MKRLFTAAVLVVALGAQLGARAETTSGHIAVGNPATILGFPGVSEASSACEPGGATDGADGQWFAVSEGNAVEAALSSGATGIEDLDVYFYTAACEYIDDLSMVTESPSETGTAPEGAAFLVVDLATGADANFEVTVSA